MLPAADRGAREGPRASQTIDRYQIVSCIGRGGMAEVYRGKLLGLGGFARDVAIKVLLPQLGTEPEFVNMLLDEARIAGTIHHNNVVQVLDVGQDGPVFYLVMEYIDGIDLRSVEKRHAGGQVPVEPLLYIMAEVLRGLEAIHTACGLDGEPLRIVHRDVTPSNVLLTRTGAVKLADFGIAHATGRLTQTRHGAVKGKTRYMAPEQLDGKGIDHRTDLFSAGVVLLEALLGREGADAWHATPMGPIFKLPVRLPPEVPPDLAAILGRALAAAPADRYETAGEFRRDVLAALQVRTLGRGDRLPYGADQLQDFLRPLLKPGDSPTRRVEGALARPAAAGPQEGSEPSQRGPAPPSLAAPSPVGMTAQGTSTTMSVSGSDSGQSLWSGRHEVHPTAPPPATQTMPLSVLTSRGPATVTMPLLGPPRAGAAAREPTEPVGPPIPHLQTLAEEADVAQMATAVTAPPRPVLDGLPTLPPTSAPTPEHDSSEVPQLRPSLRDTITHIQNTLVRTVRDTLGQLAGQPLSLRLLGMVLAGLLIGGIGVLVVYQVQSQQREMPPALEPPVASPGVAVVPKPPTPPATGQIEVSAPPGTRVFIDGALQPDPAPHIYQVPPGVHRVRLQPPRRREVIRTVEIEAGKLEHVRL
ncbi:MAG: protein kinase [Myxococcales bacterium]|nr:protein kinase [Myxococcota bacterium]MDW8283465.1 protein kinase [Myxococcales bacterium]